MKIEIIIKKINSDYVWTEKYDIDNNADAEEYAQNLVNKFNNTLRVNEIPRELVGVIVIKEQSEILHQHIWEKQNLITIVKGSQSYDIMKCSVCGITGKRYGLSDVIKRDSKYKAKVYDTCQGAIKQIKKHNS